MNDEPLPLRHGFPARLVTPGIYGYVGSTKWLTELEVTTFAAFDQYWVPRGYAERAPIDTSQASGADDTAADSATGSDGAAGASAEACDADAIVQAVENGEAEATLSGMTDDPVATAASNNPVLTTLTTAVGEAGLVDTLNSAEALTVFAPTDCAFSQLDPATLEAAMADPTGLLAQVLGFDVIPGDKLSSDELASAESLETFTGASLSVSPDGDTSPSTAARPTSWCRTYRRPTPPSTSSQRSWCRRSSP